MDPSTFRWIQETLEVISQRLDLLAARVTILENGLQNLAASHAHSLGS